MKAIMLESGLRKWWVTAIQSNGEVMIVGGNVGKIDPAQWPTIGTEEPTGADTSFDKWNYYCGSVWSFSPALPSPAFSVPREIFTFRLCTEN